jgi:cytidine deaminase
MNDKLVSQAKRVCQLAIARYSNFKVGAALVTSEGDIFTGCNIEVSSYGLTICAERVALFKALSEGAKDFKKLVIYTETEDFCPPCGACRQVIWDFAPEISIILVNKKNQEKVLSISELYPQAFGDHFFVNRDK